MRLSTAVAVLVLVAAGTSGCGDLGTRGLATKAGTSTGAASGSAGGDSSGTCAEVRAGIDAFNQGDFDATVDHFTQAVPLAKAAVAADDTPAAEQLLEAVVYYAELAPADYPDAAASSPDFEKYKVITLGQCEGGAPAPTPSQPGRTV